MRNEQNRNRNSVERRMETERETVKYSNSNKKFNSQRISLGQTCIHMHTARHTHTHIVLQFQQFSCQLWILLKLLLCLAFLITNSIQTAFFVSLLCRIQLFFIYVIWLFWQLWHTLTAGSNKKFISNKGREQNFAVVVVTAGKLKALSTATLLLAALLFVLLLAKRELK